MGDLNAGQVFKRLPSGGWTELLSAWSFNSLGHCALKVSGGKKGAMVLGHLPSVALPEGYDLVLSFLSCFLAFLGLSVTVVVDPTALRLLCTFFLIPW